MAMQIPGEKMELRTEVEIEAPPEEVWRVLTDFVRYHEWNPFIVAVEGALSPGADLRVTLTFPSGEEKRQRCRLLVCDSCEHLRWRTKVLFGVVLDSEHFFRLVGCDDGRTRLTQGQDFRGWAVKYMGPTFTLTARSFVGMNTALKRRVEQGLRAAPAKHCSALP